MHRVPHRFSVGNKPEGEYLIPAEPNDVSQNTPTVSSNFADVILTDLCSRFLLSACSTPVRVDESQIGQDAVRISSAVPVCLPSPAI